MTRCYYCGRRLWFARSGHLTIHGHLVRWHSAHLFGPVDPYTPALRARLEQLRATWAVRP